MMDKQKKKNYIEEMKDFFKKSGSVLITHYQGLSVKQIDELRAAFLVETDPATQQSLYDDMNRTFYENPPSVNNFQFASPRAHRNEVKNFCLDCLFPILNNVWLEK